MMSDLEFGDYCYIEQHRFGADNEIYIHKVVSILLSNAFVDVPVIGVRKEVIHKKMEDVVLCICCGIDESRAFKYRIEDVTKAAPLGDKTSIPGYHLGAE